MTAMKTVFYRPLPWMKILVNKILPSVSGSYSVWKIAIIIIVLVSMAFKKIVISYYAVSQVNRDVLLENIDYFGETVDGTSFNLIHFSIPRRMLSFKLSINHVLAATDCRLLCTIIDRLWKKDWQCQVLKFINSF